MGFCISCRNLTSFQCDLPSLLKGEFDGKFDLPSVQRVAHTIKDNSNMTPKPLLVLGIDRTLQGHVESELEVIRSKGWALTTRYR